MTTLENNPTRSEVQGAGDGLYGQANGNGYRKFLTQLLARPERGTARHGAVPGAALASLAWFGLPSERALARAEGGAAALMLNDGRHGLAAAVLTLAHAGQNVLISRHVSLPTRSLLVRLGAHMNFEVRWFDPVEHASLGQRINANTRLVFAEIAPAPGGALSDFDEIARTAHGAGVPVIADNTLLTARRFQAAAHGADVVVYTQQTSGLGEALGVEPQSGALVDAGSFDWRRESERWPELTTPSAAFHDVVFAEAARTLGGAALLAHVKAHWYLRSHEASRREVA